MILAKDLRIGNWVRQQHGNVEIIGIEYYQTSKTYGINFKEESGYETTMVEKAFWPIPLTPDLWGKLGFEQKESSKAIYIDGLSLCFVNNSHNNGFTLGYFKDGSLFGVSTNIYYVHQLQNLYYSLTGVELDIKL